MSKKDIKTINYNFFQCEGERISVSGNIDLISKLNDY